MRRLLFGQAVTMVVGPRCAVPLTDYPAVASAVEAGDEGFLLWGWYPSGRSGCGRRSATPRSGPAAGAADGAGDVRLAIVSTAAYVPAGGMRR